MKVLFIVKVLYALERNGILRYITGLNEFAPEVKALPEADEKS